jgi:aminopeptidase-like protein
METTPDTFIGCYEPSAREIDTDRGRVRPSGGRFIVPWPEACIAEPKTVGGRKMIMTDTAISEDLGREMHRLIGELYPICRSITGDGVRQTLRIVQRHIPLTLHEVPTGTPVFDWTVPPEWNIRDAYVKNSRGERVIDFHASNLHVVNYSRPVRATMSLDELRPHLFSDPAHPDWVPYRTTYYEDTWGFCLSDRQLRSLDDDRYEVCIDSSVADGSLTYGECVVPGGGDGEILISCHICHPSLANDNLSGIAVATQLVRRLLGRRPRHTFRFIFIPGTIGSITWLALNEDRLDAIRHGLVAANLGDSGPMNYKRSRDGAAEIDQVVEYVLAGQERPYTVFDFEPYGYDERQFCSPGINLPVGCLMRTPHSRFPEYHTSADNLDLVRPAFLAHSLETFWTVFQVLESNRRYVNLKPKCEPQLSKRGLYGAIGGRSDARRRQMAMLWVLNLSDGDHSVLDIARRSGLDAIEVSDAAATLVEHDLLAVCGNDH